MSSIERKSTTVSESLDGGEKAAEDGRHAAGRGSATGARDWDTITAMREGQTRIAANGGLKRTELIQEVARVLELSLNESATIIDAIFSSMVRALQAGDRIEIRGFGSLATRRRKPRMGRNPKTGAPVAVPTKRVAFFKPSKDLKQLIDQS